MAFQVSPGVNFTEIDDTAVVPAVSTSTGAIAGVFSWGPLKEMTVVDSEVTLVNTFGKPTANNYETFFTAADFLAYANSLVVVRTASNTAYNAVTDANTTTQIATRTAAEAHTGDDYIARYPGTLGNSLKISVCPSANAYSKTISGSISVVVGSNSSTISSAAADSIAVGDVLRIGNSTVGHQDLRVTYVSGTDVDFATNFRLASNSSVTGTRYWGEYNRVDGAPDSGSIHVVVIDEDGTISGTANTVLEVYENVSLSSGAKNEDGSTNYYKTVINERSKWIYTTSDTQAAGDTAVYVSLVNGADGAAESTISLADLAAGYDKFINADNSSIALLMQGKATAGTNDTGLANYLIDNIAEVRKDCVVFISPASADVVNNAGGELTAVTAFRNSLTSSSYAFIDSGYKRRYDKYNDVYRYTPLNGDIAGLAARTDNVRDPWFSPAGYQRGVIKNVGDLAWNPTKAYRDILYPIDINPVVRIDGQGTLLMGDKTALGRASAFSRINVRRLFIVLEKAISTASNKMLFEFNDAFTRAQFVNLVEPFLRDVMGRRGIYDFRVVCDTTNNTAEVIDRQEFVGDIYIKPARSINYIQLNFIATRTGIAFEEIVGSR